MACSDFVEERRDGPRRVRAGIAALPGGELAFLLVEEEVELRELVALGELAGEQLDALHIARDILLGEVVATAAYVEEIAARLALLHDHHAEQHRLARAVFLDHGRDREVLVAGGRVRDDVDERITGAGETAVLELPHRQLVGRADVAEEVFALRGHLLGDFAEQAMAGQIEVERRKRDLAALPPGEVLALAEAGGRLHDHLFLVAHVRDDQGVQRGEKRRRADFARFEQGVDPRGAGSGEEILLVAGQLQHIGTAGKRAENPAFRQLRQMRFPPVDILGKSRRRGVFSIFVVERHRIAGLAPTGLGTAQRSAVGFGDKLDMKRQADPVHHEVRHLHDVEALRLAHLDERATDRLLAERTLEKRIRPAVRLREVHRRRAKIGKLQSDVREGVEFKEGLLFVEVQTGAQQRELPQHAGQRFSQDVGADLAVDWENAAVVHLAHCGGPPGQPDLLLIAGKRDRLQARKSASVAHRLHLAHAVHYQSTKRLRKPGPDAHAWSIGRKATGHAEAILSMADKL